MTGYMYHYKTFYRYSVIISMKGQKNCHSILNKFDLINIKISTLALCIQIIKHIYLYDKKLLSKCNYTINSF